MSLPRGKSPTVCPRQPAGGGAPIAAPVEQPPSGAVTGRSLAAARRRTVRRARWWVACALAAGGFAGLGVNRPHPGAPAAPPEEPAAAAPAPADGPQAPVPGVRLIPAGSSAVSGARVEIEVPADPFQPTAMPSPPPARAAGTLPPPGAAKPETVRGEAPVWPPDLALTGVIRGDPPLAVLRRGEEVHYVQVGERVAGVWQLKEIQERAALFQAGEKQIEVPIRGGISE